MSEATRIRTLDETAINADMSNDELKDMLGHGLSLPTELLYPTDPADLEELAGIVRVDIWRVQCGIRELRRLLAPAFKASGARYVAPRDPAPAA